MVNTVTNNQKFTDYLTTYSVKPGQNSPEYVAPANLFKNISFRPSFDNSKDLFNTNPEQFYNVKNSGGILISSGNTINPILNYKNITIPISLNLEPTDYSDDINDFVQREKTKSINPIIDGEKVKYLTPNFEPIKIRFRFYYKSLGNNAFFAEPETYGYEPAGFLPSEINVKNGFKKSYFRLYFYDSNDTKKQNLLLTEDISIYGSVKPIFNFNKLYWLKNDPLFTGTTFSARKVYVEARFFNAKTGRVHRFINMDETVTTPPSVSTLASKPFWRSSKVLILNPNLNGGNRYFKTDVTLPNGANEPNGITFTEYILDT